MTDDPLTAWRRVEARYGLPEAVYRPTIVTLGGVGCAEIMVRQRLPDDLPTSRGKDKDTLGGGDGLVIRTDGTEML